MLFFEFGINIILFFPFYEKVAMGFPSFKKNLFEVVCYGV
jgi:hypothetical protein